MERKVAIKKLGKILGRSLGYRVNPKAPTPSEREEAKRQLPELIAERQRADKAMTDRRQAVLAADREYQELGAAYRAAKERADRAFSITRRFKITVGTSNDMFFHVKAEGDSWEEVIDALSRRK